MSPRANQGSNMPTKTKQSSATFEVAHERRNFHALLASNPNYFGTLPEVGFPVSSASVGMMSV